MYTCVCVSPCVYVSICVLIYRILSTNDTLFVKCIRYIDVRCMSIYDKMYRILSSKGRVLAGRLSIPNLWFRVYSLQDSVRFPVCRKRAYRSLTWVSVVQIEWVSKDMEESTDTTSTVNGSLSSNFLPPPSFLELIRI